MRELLDASAATGVERRLLDLLALGVDALEALGRAPGRDADTAARQLEDIGSSAARLAEVNQRLAPLLRAFQPPAGGSRWWRWYTGAQLEYEVQLADVCKKVAALVDTGQQAYRGLRVQVETLASQYKLMRTEIELLEADIDALTLIASPEYLTERLTAGFGEQEKARLAQRLAILQGWAETTRHTRSEYEAAIQRAQPVADRYREIRATLLPVWKRAVGFDLFVRGAETIMPMERA